jgi:hypothetical protein
VHFGAIKECGKRRIRNNSEIYKNTLIFFCENKLELIDYSEQGK